jgi:hypothetical protein
MKAARFSGAQRAFILTARPPGEYRYEGSIANRALELLGKQQDVSIDRQKVGQPGEFANMTGEELEAWIMSEDKRLGLMSSDAFGGGRRTKTEKSEMALATRIS